jgi:NAD(P)-dependent dehydrogenase (short-subunit alcohol dehydrogenase family)
MDLTGIRAIVTGGASGIGAATVRELQGHDAHVTVLDLHENPDADASVVCDVGDEDALVDAIGRLSRLDVAVANAGVGGTARLIELTTGEWDRVMRVNLRGTFVTIRECAKKMREHGGSIVAVSSVSGTTTERLMAHYSVSKAGVNALVKVAARELGPYGIRVNAIAPGTTDTPMFQATDRLPGYRERVTGRTPLQRLGTARDIAFAIVAVLQSDWINGQVVAVDGGLTLTSPLDPADSLE